MHELGRLAAFAIPILALALVLGSIGVLWVLLKGCLVLRRLRRETPERTGNELLKSTLVPGVSLIVVAAEASPAAKLFVRRLLMLDFGKPEVVLVLDGPSDEDMAAWSLECNLVRATRITGELPSSETRGTYISRDPTRLVVVDKERGSLADALNAGVNVARWPIIGLFDPENDFPPDALQGLIQPMLSEPDETVAVCGVMPREDAGTLPQQLAVLEALRVWMGRVAAFTGWNALLPVPGCAWLMRRSAVQAVGGFRAGPIELFLDVHQHARAAAKPYRVALVAQPVSRAPLPDSIAGLRRAVLRDQRTLARAFLHSGRVAVNPALAALISWRVLMPLAETLMLVLLVAACLGGAASMALLLLVFLASVAAGALVSAAAVVFNELSQSTGGDPAHLLGLGRAAVAENLGYRQLRNLWLIEGLFGGR